MNDNDESRKDQRRDIPIRVKFKSATIEEFIDQYSKDVSRGGIFIKHKDPAQFPVRTLIKFSLLLADGTPFINGIGRVVWIREISQATVDRPPGMGIKFIKLDEKSRAIIDRVVKGKNVPDDGSGPPGGEDVMGQAPKEKEPEKEEKPAAAAEAAPVPVPAPAPEAPPEEKKPEPAPEEKKEEPKAEEKPEEKKPEEKPEEKKPEPPPEPKPEPKKEEPKAEVKAEEKKPEPKKEEKKPEEKKPEPKKEEKKAEEPKPVEKKEEAKKPVSLPAPEEEKKTSTWVWAIVILIILVIVYFVISQNKQKKQEETPPPPTAQQEPKAPEPPPAPAKVQVALAVKPDGSSLFVDGKPMGGTPIAPLEFDPGAKVTAKAQMLGFKAVQKEFVVAAGMAPVPLELAEKVPVSIVADSEPTGATILVDGKNPAKGPRVIENVDMDNPPKITFKLKGYEEKSVQVSRTSIFNEKDGKHVIDLMKYPLMQIVKDEPAPPAPPAPAPAPAPAAKKPPVTKVTPPPPVAKEPAVKPPAEKKPPVEKKPPEEKKPPKKKDLMGEENPYE